MMECADRDPGRGSATQPLFIEANVCLAKKHTGNPEMPYEHLVQLAKTLDS